MGCGSSSAGVAPPPAQAEAAQTLERHLSGTHKLPQEAAETYARALVSGGCDNIGAFEELLKLSPEQLKTDYGFKPGHTKKLTKSRTKQSLSDEAGAKPTNSTAGVAEPERRGSREAFEELPDIPDDLFDSEFFMDMLDPFSAKFAFAMSAKTILAAKRWRRRSANVIMQGKIKEAEADAAAVATQKEAEAAVKKLEVAGFHGCPFFTVAASVAVALLKRGAVERVVIRRAGHLHVPTWKAEGDRGPFKRYVRGMPHTAKWTGSSPRVVLDDDPETAIGGSDITVQFAKQLAGETYGAAAVDWEEGTGATSISIIKYAFNQDAETAAKMFAGDPPGPARLGMDDPTIPGLRWEDMAEEGTVYGPFALEDSPFVQRTLTPEAFALAAASASEEAKVAATSIAADLPRIKSLPEQVQDWFKSCLAQGTKGISELIAGAVNSPLTTQTAGKSDEFKAQVIACLEMSDYRELAAAVYPELQLAPTPQPVSEPQQFADSSDDEADAEAAELMAAIES
jgi:hypothetical protein|eukprot:COSAG06_NODE_7524_length_2471_cov_10.453204_1_plen_512_part_00